jgi:hypothetical protein
MSGEYEHSGSKNKEAFTGASKHKTVTFLKTSPMIFIEFHCSMDNISLNETAQVETS